MPTQRFFRLREEKRTQIISAAMEEFSSYRFEELSMSRIAKTAGISHGSLYTYFGNKEDLRQYLFLITWADCRRWIYQALDVCHGNICDTALYSIVKLLKMDRENVCFQFYQNVLFDVGWFGKMENIQEVFPHRPDAEFQEFVDVCYQKADLSSVCQTDKEGFFCLLELLLLIVLKTAVCMITGQQTDIRLLMNAERQIQLLRK